MIPLPYAPNPPQRVFAAWTGAADNTIVDEAGQKWPGESWQNVKACLAEGRTILSPSLAGRSWLGEALADGASPSLTPLRGLTALRVKPYRDKRRSGWVIDAATWGGLAGASRGQPSPTLQSIRDALNRIGTGSHNTPSAAGLMAMSLWFDGRAERLFRPSASCERIIRGNLVGGRVDTLRPREEFERLYEVDINDAYPWGARRVPAGRCYALARGGTGAKKAAFLRCRIRRNGRMGELGEVGNIGPLPVRRAGGRLEYPTEGEWTGWYWREEIEAAREAGYTVIPECGWEWSDWSDGLATWARRMHETRYALRAHPGGERSAGLVKLAAVAAIGRLGGAESAYEITEDETGTPYMDRCSGLLDPDGNPWPWSIREKPAHRPELLPHVASYINAQVRLATWRKAMEEAREGALVATNYDAVLTLRRPSFAPSTELGGWKWTELHPGERGLSVPYPRGLHSAEKERLPGTPYIFREAA